MHATDPHDHREAKPLPGMLPSSSRQHPWLAGPVRSTTSSAAPAGGLLSARPPTPKGGSTSSPRHDYLDGRIRPDAVICCPATFNTLNKWAAGINDSPALGVLNDAVGLGTPLLAVPMVGERLSRHPVWPATLDFLATAGITLLDVVTGQHTQTPSGIESGTGDAVTDAFDPHLLLHWLTQATQTESTG